MSTRSEKRIPLVKSLAYQLGEWVRVPEAGLEPAQLQ